jgi:hypothetical protein
MERGLTALMLSVAYYYYRLCWNSVSIAEELGLKPRMIRVWLWRMNALADGRRRRKLERETAKGPSNLAFFRHRMREIKIPAEPIVHDRSHDRDDHQNDCLGLERICNY